MTNKKVRDALDAATVPTQIVEHRMIKGQGGALLRLVEYGDGARVIWYEVPAGDWVVAYRLAPQGGQPVVAELRIFPGPMGKREAGSCPWARPAPTGGLPQRVLRDVKMGPHRDDMALVMKEWAAWLGEAVFEGSGMFGAAGLTSADRPSRHRESRAALLRHARLARDYVELLDKGEKHPTKALAEKEGEDPQRMTETINRARRRYGLLTEAPGGRHGGRPGGRLTPKALAVLAEGSEGHVP